MRERTERECEDSGRRGGAVIHAAHGPRTRTLTRRQHGSATKRGERGGKGAGSRGDRRRGRWARTAEILVVVLSVCLQERSALRRDGRRGESTSNGLTEAVLRVRHLENNE